MTFDLDAWVADQLNAGQPFTFTFGGVDFELPPEPDPRTAALFDAGLYNEAFRRMLGEDQYRKFIATDAPLTRDAILEIIRKHAEHAGASLGESSASSGSSKPTARRSKRTSNGSSPSTSGTSDAV